MHDIYKRNGLSSSTSHHDRQIPNFSRPSILFPKQSKDFLSFLKFKEFSCLALNSRLAQEPCSSYRFPEKTVREFVVRDFFAGQMSDVLPRAQ